MTRLRHVVIAVVCLTTASTTGGAALAEAPASQPDAAALLQRGVELFADGAFSESRLVLGAALKATDKPKLMAQLFLYIGLNSAAENDVERARGAFRQALLHDPDLEIDPHRHKPSLVRLFRAVRHAMEGRLEVSVDRKGVSLLIDGGEVGQAPFAGRLLAGTHEVVLQAPDGTVVHRKSVRVMQGQVTRLVLALGRPGQRRTGSAAASSGRRAEPSRAGQKSKPRRVWTWVAAGGAAAGLAVAIATTVMAASDHGEACDLLADDSLPCADRKELIDPAERERYAELRDSVNANALAANIAWGAAGVLAITAAVLFWVEGRPSEPTPLRETRAAPSLGLTPLLGQTKGASLVWRY